MQYCTFNATWACSLRSCEVGEITSVVSYGFDAEQWANTIEEETVNEDGVFMVDGDEKPCELTLTCQDTKQGCHAISDIVIISDARNVEVYNDVTEYVETVRGSLVSPGSKEVVYCLQIHSETPLRKCTLKFVSLFRARQLTLNALHVVLRSEAPRPAAVAAATRAGVDFEKVERMLRGVRISDDARNMMTSISAHQRATTSSPAVSEGPPASQGPPASMASMMALLSMLGTRQHQPSPLTDASSLTESADGTRQVAAPTGVVAGERAELSQHVSGRPAEAPSVGDGGADDAAGRGDIEGAVACKRCDAARTTESMLGALERRLVARFEQRFDDIDRNLERILTLLDKRASDT
ncbi:PREDICTED: uncharacterized protein LOC106814519 [Priapulus caudatus]|uniref:Uncharacterized protein LOC106814519 n=1 Tax=Priapulus caudatus TaxID=37621 RepID=A0ABM1EQ48_PRICU|nr:PREDICTED: uncharacterized protein LOC106814519 [Priapulus caudatus]